MRFRECRFYEKADEISGGDDESSLNISVLFLCIIRQQNKSGCLEEAINTMTFLEPSGDCQGVKIAL
jgi:hypothetical protein